MTEELMTFTLMDGAVWSTFMSWAAYRMRGYAVADWRRGNRAGAARALWFAAALMVAAIAFVWAGMGLGHRAPATTWSVLGVGVWMLGWWRLGRWEAQGRARW